MKSPPTSADRPASMPKGVIDDSVRTGKSKKALGQKEVNAASSKLESLLSKDSSPKPTPSPTGLHSKPKSKHQHTHSEKSHDPADVVPISLGDSILKSMMNASPNAQTGQVSAPLRTDKSDSVSEIVGQIAEKLLVSEPSSGEREVRIVLKESVLPGTEVRLTEAGGRLQVKFVTETATSQSVLQNNQEVLQTRLQEVTGKTVAVAITTESAMSNDDHPSDGRSRGHQQILNEEDQE